MTSSPGFFLPFLILSFFVALLLGMGSGILHVRDVSQGAASIYFPSSLMQCSSQAEIKIDMICSSNPNKKATLIHPFLPLKLPELVKNDSETIFLRPLEKTSVYHPLLCLAVSLFEHRLLIFPSGRAPFIPDYIHPRLPAVIRSPDFNFSYHHINTPFVNQKDLPMALTTSPIPDL
jgi:hypothetical protein